MTVKDPLQLVQPEAIKDALVTEILGEIAVGGAARASSKRGAPNSTRWVFDIELPGPGLIEVELLDYYGRPARPDIEPSFHITPMCDTRDARYWGETKRGVLTFQFSAQGRFRIDVDIIGTNRR